MNQGELIEFHGELEAQNSKRIQNTVLNDTLIVPADLLAMIKRRQLAHLINHGVKQELAAGCNNVSRQMAQPTVKVITTLESGTDYISGHQYDDVQVQIPENYS
ncbi:hypothetical protein Ocin01_14438 [Orchesella cincta]|uniref:Uncharacterized protein n=1 Tax=Orchesella cincta TaxID=48709 RepID=A0A1D2MHE1_ORCCI|nr:hypothetical protein Ocin01_14438 [Orchesella cincta]